jgi:hypothetical protein
LGIQKGIEKCYLALDLYLQKTFSLDQLIEELVFPDSDAILNFRRNDKDEIIFLDKLLKLSLRRIKEPVAGDIIIPYEYFLKDRLLLP